MPGGRGLDTTAFVSGPNGIPERTERDPWASCLAFGPRFSPDSSLVQALPIGASPAPTSPPGFGSQTLGGTCSRLSCPGRSCLASRVTALDGRAGSQPQPDWPQVSQECFPCTHSGPQRPLGGSLLAQRLCLPAGALGPGCIPEFSGSDLVTTRRWGGRAQGTGTGFSESVPHKGVNYLKGGAGCVCFMGSLKPK